MLKYASYFVNLSCTCIGSHMKQTQFSNNKFVFPDSLCQSTSQATFVKCTSTHTFISVQMKKEHVEYLANIVWANDELSAVSASQNDILNNAEAYLDWLLTEYW